MRVAFITHYTTLYGANRSLLSLVDGLRRYDVVSHVVAPAEGDVTNALRGRSVPIAVMPIQWWVASQGLDGFDAGHLLRWLYKYLRWRSRTLERLSGNIRVLPKLVKQLKLWNVDVVYTNTSVTPVGAMAARILQRPHIWHLREFSDLHYGYQYDWGKSIFRLLIGRADAVIAISEAIRTYHLRDAKSERTHVIHNGVASVAEFDRLYDKVNSNPNYAFEANRPYTFALVGVIHPAKGQDAAIRALALLAREFEKVRLLIVGEGRTDRLKALAHDLGVTNRVEFWGYVDDPYKAYLASDAVLMCSRNEAMGRVTAEAMSACRPVIGYDEAGTSEIIEHGHTGLLYRGGPEALASCMRQFVENPVWARQLGNNGWDVARKKYSVEVYAQSVYEVLSSVVKMRTTLRS
jgi:glycosyltransferase involved in cell wall biosynthesis